MGWQNQRNSLWHILLHKKQKRESQVHYWPIGSRTPKAPGRGERCVSFHTPYKICPIKPILLLYKGFLKDTYLFLSPAIEKTMKTWDGHAGPLQKAQQRSGSQRTKTPQAAQPSPVLPCRFQAMCKGHVCVSIKREERVNPKALTIPLLLMVSLRKVPLAYQRLVQEWLWETVYQLDSIWNTQCSQLLKGILL